MQSDSIQLYDTSVMEDALAAFMLRSLGQKARHKRVKINMECRRKLEAIKEAQELKKVTQEYWFDEQ